MRQTFRASALALALVPILPFGVTTATTSAAAQGGDARQVLARTAEKYREALRLLAGP